MLLVGAGPGDPELITLRGAAALRAADAVVYDSLAAPELLDLAPASALRIDVGKRGHDAPTRSQPETTALMLDLARGGRTVVRLKGGDPFVFGRGGEEASACAAAGIPFEVVPGVSSVAGALGYAGIPLTDRRHAASFAVVTGHKDPTPVAEATRWEALARAADTLVILMGMRNLETLVARILDSGRDPDTPAAVVMDGTLPRQRVVEAPLGELVARVREAGLGAPAVVVIGDVVRLRRELAWFERRPLFGRRVLVTRASHQAGPLVAALRAAGAEPVCIPLLRIAPPEEPEALRRAIDGIGSYDALLFTSANAVRAVAVAAAERGCDLSSLAVRAFCVGPRTAEEARGCGLHTGRVPDRHDARGLLAEIGKALPPAGRRFLLPRAARARELLPRALRSAGAEVDEVVAYRTDPAEVDAADLRRRLTAGELDVLSFASPSSVRHFLALLDPAARRAVGRCAVAAIGPVTADALRSGGIEPDVVAEGASAEGLVEALVGHFVAPERARADSGSVPPDGGIQ